MPPTALPACASPMKGAASAAETPNTNMLTAKTTPVSRCTRPPFCATIATAPAAIPTAPPPMCTASIAAAAAWTMSGAPGGTTMVVTTALPPR